MIRYLKTLGVVLLAAAMVSCGGGGGSPGSTSSGSGSSSSGGSGSTTPATAAVATFIYQLSESSLKNSGSDSSVLTVTALDANNNPVSGASVSVAVDTGVYTPSSTTTDASGQTTGAITIGANKTSRNITATIKVNNLTAQAVLPVVGAQNPITITPVPATPAPGATVNVNIKVIDANLQGVPNVAVTLSGTLGLTGTVTTDQNGNATATLGAAPSTSGSYTVNASALGAQGSTTVQVINGANSGIPVVTDTISAASLAIVPTTIAPNTTGSTTNRANLKATFLNASNQAVQNVRVRFEIVPPALGAGEAISTGTATVYSDNTGVAIADYIAGSRSSPTNGVVIRACYGPDDTSIANSLCPNAITKTLTVSSQPLSITLGDNNVLQRGNNGLTYIKQFDVAVADSAGNAVPNAVISASVDINYYGKGPYVAVASTPNGTAVYQITGNNPPPANQTSTFSLTTIPTAATGRVWCPNEDFNRNGSLDTGEDINGDGVIEPRKADVILSFPGSNVTGSDGRMAIQVEYPMNVATWETYTVTVTTNVAGSEGTDSKSYITSFIIGDDSNGSFLTPPYGSSSCNSPN